MFYLNWQFTLIALSVTPVLFVLIYYLHPKNQESLPRSSQEGR